MNLLQLIKDKAKTAGKTIVLPESNDERVLKAGDKILQEGLASIVLLGDKTEILAKAESMGLENLQKAKFENPADSSNKERYADIMVEMRKHKGMTKEKALELLSNPLFFATLMVKAGDADGEVAGAINATGDVLLPAFQYVKTKPGMSVVSGAFIMILPDDTYGDNGILFFADCAVFPNPNADQLAEIAVATGATAKAIAGIDPRIALLSYSTKGSARGELVSKVTDATKKAQALAPDMVIDGELQVDAALVDSVAKSKAPGSEVAGKANVLVFPDLQSGNIGYKLVQRLAKAEAIGPILQGMAAPINDLSRGCSAEDIVNLVAITATQAI